MRDEYFKNKWLEDIEVYERHKNLCRQEVDRIKHDFERADRKIPLSYEGKLYDLREAIKEYDRDIEKLKQRISEL